MLGPNIINHLKKDAEAVLRLNDMGDFTKPAPRLYPHQWNWDSVFNAIGWSHIDEERAWREIDSLLRGQWKNGMVPHILFDTEVNDYHPGPDYWDTSSSFLTPDDVLTSGITQPPLLTYGTWEVYRNSKDKEKAEEWLRSLYSRLLAYHTFLHTMRDLDGSGLAAIVHPWESGQDNSPRWDGALKAIRMEWKPEYTRVDNTIIAGEQRPTDQDYDRYSTLVEVFRKLRYDPRRMWEESPFLVRPVLFNSVLLASDRCLKEMAEILGEDTGDIEIWIQAAESGISTKMWDENSGLYFDIDLRCRAKIRKRTLAGFLPLFAGIPDEEGADRLVRSLLDSESFWPEGGYPYCTVSRKEAEFDPKNYWRGPIWINMNWFIVKGLNHYGYKDKASYVIDRTLALVDRSGFFEYFHPMTGDGLGSDAFSWTASLVIDLIENIQD